MAASSHLIRYFNNRHSYSMPLKSFGGDLQSDHQNQRYMLQEFLSCLEEECRKIDPFKHDLPLCMQLLTNAMEASRQQLEALGVNQGTRAVREESIYIEHSAADKESNKFYKADWVKASEGTKRRQQPTNISGSSKDQRSASSQGSSLRGPPDDEKEMDNKKYEEEEEAGRKRKNSGGNDGVAVVDRGKGTNPVASHAQTSATTTAAATAASAYTRKTVGHTWSPKQWRSTDMPKQVHFEWRRLRAN